MEYDGDFDVDQFLDLDALEEEGFMVAAAVTAEPQQDPLAADHLVNPDTLPDANDGYFDVDQFLDLDALEDEDFMVHAAVTAEPQQDPPATHLPMPHTVPNVNHGQAQFQAVAPPPVQHQQTPGESSAYGQMLMPAPVARAQPNIPETPSDQVPGRSVLHQRMLGQPNPNSPDCLQLMDPEFLARHGHYDIAEALIGDEVNQAGGSSDADGAPDVVLTEDDENQASGSGASGAPNVGPMEDERYPIGGSGTSGAPEVGSMEKDEEGFVPLLPGRLQCSDCCVAREIRSRNETRLFCLFLHASKTRGTFEHAILDRHYIGEQTPMTEYINLRRHPREWVLKLMASIVTSERAMCTVEDSNEAPLNFNIDRPPVVNDAYQQNEISMLLSIMNGHTNDKNVEASVPPLLPPAAQHPAMEAAPNVNLFSETTTTPDIPEPLPVILEQQSSESALVHSSRRTREQGRTARRGKEQEVRHYLREQKEKAQNELDISSAIRLFCRRNGLTQRLRWIRTINRKIIDMEERAVSFTLDRLMPIRDTVHGYVIEKEDLIAEITSLMKKERESKNDHEAGPSVAKKGGVAL
ncbi:hypothetical protein ZWY2020_037259 [Hordeum vulgare]|nr:hypothetical protein ZWY2020_037259 [Hordeum vulgare]